MKVILSKKMHGHVDTNKQFATFFLDGRLYGLDVAQVQEVTKPLKFTVMRTAPTFIKGLINLRGQIATAVDLRDLLGLSRDDTSEKMTVVCRVDEILLSLQVDTIGDVIEVSDSKFERPPLTIPSHIRSYMLGVYKIEKNILSVLDLKEIINQLEKKSA